MKRLTLFALTLSALLSSFQLASATPFGNGRFETGMTTGGANQAAISPGTIPSWIVGSSGYLEFNSNGENGQTAQSGSQFVSFGHSSNTGETLSQTFDTIMGEMYQITYYVSRIQGGTDDTQSMSLTAFDDMMNTLGSVNTMIPGPSENNLWVLGTTLSFTAASSSTRIEFLDTTTGGGDDNWALDTVAVSGPGLPVPESGSSILLLALSLAVFIPVHRVLTAFRPVSRS